MNYKYGSGMFMGGKKWYKLDNVGKFYSSIANRQFQNVFRYSVTLTEDVEESILQEALDSTMDVFPNFNVNLKQGIFWYYLNETNKKYIVNKENLPICFKIYNNSNDFLYRVSYYNKRINFEISHILSDGRGSVEVFKTLINNYIKIKYNLNNVDITTCNSYTEKAEDSFCKYYKKMKRNNKENSIKRVYYYNGRKLKNKTRYLEVHLPLSKVLNLAHKNNSTLTTLVVAVLIYSFKDIMSETDLNKNIKIDIPVDLRQYYKSSSSKNYFGLTSVVYKFKNREDKLEDIIKSVSDQLKENLAVENLSIRANKMVAFEKNVFCRIAPIFIKKIVLKIIDIFTSRMSTSCISNLGKITFEKEIMPYIKDVNIMTSTTSFQFTLCSYNEDLSIGISSKYKYNDAVKNFCNYFSKQDIDVIINASEVN